MNRRVSGLVLLLLAVTAVVIVRAVQHPGVAGRPVAAPLPGPPAVGSCLLLQDGVPRPVDCADPHDLEVIAGVEADATSPTVAQCRARAADYLAPILVDDWQVPVAVDVAVVSAPTGERVGSRGWQACTVRPSTHDRFTGSLRGMTLATYRTDLFGTCFDRSTGPDLPCDGPHDAERLGTADLVETDPAFINAKPYYGINYTAVTLPDSVLADLTRRCRSLAVALTGAADPTYGGQLEIRADIRSVLTTERRDTVEIVLGCLAVAPAGRPLTGSVVGLGSRPLPFG